MTIDQQRQVFLIDRLIRQRRRNETGDIVPDFGPHFGPHFGQRTPERGRMFIAEQGAIRRVIDDAQRRAPRRPHRHIGIEHQRDDGAQRVRPGLWRAEFARGPVMTRNQRRHVDILARARAGSVAAHQRCLSEDAARCAPTKQKRLACVSGRPTLERDDAASSRVEGTVSFLFLS